MKAPLSLLLVALTLTACGSAAASGHPRAAAGATSPAGPLTAASPLPSALAAQPTSSPPAASVASTPAAAMSAHSPAPVPAASPAVAGTVVTSWVSPKYGQILVDSRGFVLYLFTPDDATGTPTCTGSCAAAWPPFKPGAGAPHAEGAVQQSKLGVSGGQVTYNGHPLYFYAGDPGAHQANGQCSGRIWYVIGVDGNAVMTC